LPKDSPEWPVWVCRAILTVLFLAPLYVATRSGLITGLASFVALAFWFLVAVTEIHRGIIRS